MSTTNNTSPRKRLTRSITDRWIAGVCGGVANYFNIDPVLVRIIFIVLILAGILPGVLLYIAAWIIMPEGI
ncbi:PspC domain-containing protein [Corynebacterium sanguinis]|uniref:PspC domain-containing protein n=1 Tax=Corynebacterium sanguinis TaxID=2594913 RepID=A0A6C1TUA4_9CORY|nr:MULTISPECIES: PspC domain-containing protein [Corynebacterium]MBA4506212.1 PspC domain-containing protein [Corynebacterium sanguinis]MCT1412767.1 PspC domain-containing protein [Corynebacterium sanguinis]MCT1414033.1 PspC domain-containing protein [Corynebacterium sanguinis]MCT1425656.1 PspC domain-containing protein [Corynebacterium sanguinis]MCT1444562.1 PspC domain-containing protein [Corynebacterium sanguinis]